MPWHGSWIRMRWPFCRGRRVRTIRSVWGMRADLAAPVRRREHGPGSSCVIDSRWSVEVKGMGASDKQTGVKRWVGYPHGAARFEGLSRPYGAFFRQSDEPAKPRPKTAIGVGSYSLRDAAM